MMKIKKIGYDSGKDPFIYLNKDSIAVVEGGLSAGMRIEIKNNINRVAGELILVSNNNISKDEIGLSDVAFKNFKGKEGDEAEVLRVGELKSFNAIRAKMSGVKFSKEDLFAIIKDIVDGYYSPSYMAAFCCVCEGQKMDTDEVAYLTEAMVKTGTQLKWDYDIVVDKHCLGGIPANRTTNIVIPIVAAYGLHIPKTSSRAITSPSGTADTMEVLCNIDLSSEKIKEVVEKCNGCIGWGGGVDLSPSDGIIINTRKALNIDSEGQMAASVLSKKIAAGSTDILIVAPVGPTAKVKDMEHFNRLKELFEGIGRQMGVNVVFAYEDGNQPIGNGIGPALEALDILKLFKNEPDAPQDLKEVSLQLAGQIIEFDKKVKKGDGYNIAKKIVESGEAYKKFMEIIEAQGDPRKISEAKYTHDYLAKQSGKVSFMDNKKISKTCRILGCPEKKVSGIFLHKHLNDSVKEGEVLFTLHCDSQGGLNEALKFLDENEIISIK